MPTVVPRSLSGAQLLLKAPPLPLSTEGGASLITRPWAWGQPRDESSFSPRFTTHYCSFQCPLTPHPQRGQAELLLMPALLLPPPSPLDTWVLACFLHTLPAPTPWPQDSAQLPESSSSPHPSMNFSSLIASPRPRREVLMYLPGFLPDPLISLHLLRTAPSQAS